MNRHRWKLLNLPINSKQYECIKCGIIKEWYGGDYQCWHYTWTEDFKTHSGGQNFSIKTSFNRPDCKPLQL